MKDEQGKHFPGNITIIVAVKKEDNLGRLLWCSFLRAQYAGSFLVASQKA